MSGGQQRVMEKHLSRFLAGGDTARGSVGVFPLSFSRCTAARMDSINSLGIHRSN